MTTLFVPGMHCEKCQATIEKTLKPIQGTRYVRVDLEARQVEVGGAVEAKVLINALQGVGFYSEPA